MPYFFFFAVPAITQSKISVEAKPTVVFIERGETRQYINFDFLVTNHSKDTLSLSRLELTVYDKNNTRQHTRFLDNNGTAPGMNTIPNREFRGAGSALIFNPFTEFELSISPVKLVYDWTFTNSKEEEIKISLNVYPEVYEQKLQFTFPLKGKLLVYDAHDLYAHHRRFDYEFAPIKQLGIKANFMRYAYDFVLLDNNDREFDGNGKTDEQYEGFGKPVFSIGPGKVVYASGNHKDDKTFDVPGMAANPLELYGNCVAVQHADGIVSIYGHLKQNSLTVKTGDRIKGGERIGQIGVSGSSFFPHLHFEIRSSIEHTAEGLPSYFSNVYIRSSAGRKKLNSGLVETGNIIETR